MGEGPTDILEKLSEVDERHRKNIHGLADKMQQEVTKTAVLTETTHQNVQMLLSHTKRFDDHSERMRDLEEFRIRIEASRSGEEREMRESFRRIEEHLRKQDEIAEKRALEESKRIEDQETKFEKHREEQDKKIDDLSVKVTRWAGGLAALLAAASLGLAIYTTFKK